MSTINVCAGLCLWLIFLLKAEGLLEPPPSEPGEAATGGSLLQHSMTTKAITSCDITEASALHQSGLEMVAARNVGRRYYLETCLPIVGFVVCALIHRLFRCLRKAGASHERLECDSLASASSSSAAASSRAVGNSSGSEFNAPSEASKPSERVCSIPKLAGNYSNLSDLGDVPSLQKVSLEAIPCTESFDPSK